MQPANDIGSLEEALGYRFKGKALCTRALTHSSVQTSRKNKTGDYERLEFLGDRVLGLAIAAKLNDVFPSANEGELARHFNRLVRGRTCAVVGREIEIGAHLVLSDSEESSGGRDKETILADAVEAILAVIFLESGFEVASGVVYRLWQHHWETLPEAKPDAKSALQEWAQGHGRALPLYVELAREGPAHAPKFKAQVQIEGTSPSVGEGNSKRAAEQAAARALLHREGVWKVNE